MAETQEATDGYMGEFWLHNGTQLYELQQVKEFDVPSGGAFEQAETTHLKTEDRRHSYLSTFREDEDIELLLNSRPMSDTDVLLDTAREADDVRAFKAVVPEGGVPTTQVTGTCRVIGYTRGRVVNGQVLEATATIRVVTVDAIAPYAA
jgi:hypothetical protein